MKPTLAIIIVSWNVRELLRACLQATERSLHGSGIDYALVVVDNASSDGTPVMLRNEFPHVYIIESGSNIGFGAGNNVALRTLLDPSLHSPVDYILLLNPDTEPLGDAIPRLVRELAARPELAAVGPLLRYGDGAPQPSRRRFPTQLTFFWESTVLARVWPGNPWAADYRYAATSDDHAQPVDWLVGAAVLVRAEAVRRAGLFDERYFMYSEELEWQARIQRTWREHAGGARAGRRPSGAIWYIPEAVVVHYEGKSSEQAVAGRHLNFNRSRLLLARCWYGWRLERLLRAFLRFGFAYELAVEGAKLLLGHRPELRRQRIGVYWRVLRELS